MGETTDHTTAPDEAPASAPGLPIPADLGIIDTMLGIPDGHREDWYEFLKPQLREESSDYEFPVQYMFKGVPEEPNTDDPVAWTLQQMDRWGIEMAMIGATGQQGQAVSDHP